MQKNDITYWISRRIQENLKICPFHSVTNTGKYNESAVLVPLLLRDSGIYILFTQRADNLPHHKGQISFPGGKVELQDNSPLHTALRETEEEIGLSREKVQILGRLDDEITMVSNFIIHPFVGLIQEPFKYSINTKEVQRILEMPLVELLFQEPCECEIQCEGGLIKAEAYMYEGCPIWGATYRILNKFLKLLR